MHEMPELDNPGFSGVYRVNSKTGEVSIVETEMQQPNGIGITPDSKLIGQGFSKYLWKKAHRYWFIDLTLTMSDFFMNVTY